jgi:hypothetical protein
MTSLKHGPCIRIQFLFTRCHLLYHQPQTPHLVSASGTGRSKPQHYIITLQLLLDASHSLQVACRLMVGGPRGPQLLGLTFPALPIGPRYWTPVPVMTTTILDCRVTPFESMPATSCCSSSGPLSPSAATGYGNTTMSELRWLSTDDSNRLTMTS